MERLLKKLNDAQVRYVVIGGQAMLQEGTTANRRHANYCPVGPVGLVGSVGQCD